MASAKKSRGNCALFFFSFFAGSLLAGHLAALAPSLRKPDRNRLFATLDFLAGSSALQRTPLSLVHRPLDFLTCFSPIFGHLAPPLLPVEIILDYPDDITGGDNP
jgi:hypothetical protein